MCAHGTTFRVTILETMKFSDICLTVGALLHTLIATHIMAGCMYCLWCYLQWLYNTCDKFQNEWTQHPQQHNNEIW